MGIDHQPDQNQLAQPNRYLALAGAKRRRSVKKTRPSTYSAPAGGGLFQPMTDHNQLAPQLMPQIIRRQVQPMIRR